MGRKVDGVFVFKQAFFLWKGFIELVENIFAKLEAQQSGKPGASGQHRKPAERSNGNVEDGEFGLIHRQPQKQGGEEEKKQPGEDVVEYGCDGELLVFFPFFTQKGEGQ